MQLYVFVLAGLVLSLIFGIDQIQSQRWYALATATLLAVGLYSSTYGIVMTEARRHAKLILGAITIGVLLKAAIIGTIMTLALRSAFGYILGIAVAQIDPLSTAALQKGKRLSKKAKTILSAWASFDDPITVILALYAPVLVAALSNTQFHVIQGTMQDAGLTAYLTETGMNLLFAGLIFALWSFVRRYTKARSYVVLIFVALAMYTLLAASFSIAIYFFWMLGIAVIGLFMRPAIEGAVERVVQWALCIAGSLLGILLWNGLSFTKGLVLGLAVFGAQIMVGNILCRKLPRKDRLHIAFAQQNGITAIILALLFEPYYPGTIAIIAPAILVVKVAHFVANKLLDAYLDKRLHSELSLRTQAERLRTYLAKI